MNNQKKNIVYDDSRNGYTSLRKEDIPPSNYSQHIVENGSEYEHENVHEYFKKAPILPPPLEFFEKNNQKESKMKTENYPMDSNYGYPCIVNKMYIPKQPNRVVYGYRTEGPNIKFGNDYFKTTPDVITVNVSTPSLESHASFNPDPQMIFYGKNKVSSSHIPTDESYDRTPEGSVTFETESTNSSKYNLSPADYEKAVQQMMRRRYTQNKYYHEKVKPRKAEVQSSLQTMQQELEKLRTEFSQWVEYAEELNKQNEELRSIISSILPKKRGRKPKKSENSEEN